MKSPPSVLSQTLARRGRTIASNAMSSNPATPPSKIREPPPNKSSSGVRCYKVEEKQTQPAPSAQTLQQVSRTNIAGNRGMWLPRLMLSDDENCTRIRSLLSISGVGGRAAGCEALLRAINVNRIRQAVNTRRRRDRNVTCDKWQRKRVLVAVTLPVLHPGNSLVVNLLGTPENSFSHPSQW